MSESVIADDLHIKGELTTNGDVEHKGKRPKFGAETSESSREMIRMRRELKEAVEREDYELASELRDKIKQLETSG